MRLIDADALIERINREAGLFLEAKAIGKGRPRFYGGHAVTPQATRDYERMIAEEYRKQSGADFGDRPVAVLIVVGYAMPKSWSKKKREEMRDRPHTQKPDADNIAKAILDGLQQGGAFEDDSRVARLSVSKRYSDTNYIEIYIRELR